MEESLMELALWMIALDKAEAKALGKRGICTDEAEFYATWWLSLDDATNGGAWKLANVYHHEAIAS